MRISFSGASFGGKTSQIETLSNQYNVHQEAGMLFIEKLLKSMSVGEFLGWRKSNNQKYYTDIILFQHDVEKQADPLRVNIFDRSVLDYIALMSLESNLEVKRLSGFYKYVRLDHVFVFYPLDSFDRRSSTGRLLDKDGAHKLSETTELLCDYLGIRCDVVPVSSFEDQKKFISKKIKAMSAYEFEIRSHI